MIPSILALICSYYILNFGIERSKTISPEGKKFRSFLKWKLKANDINYESLALSLEVSVATVKRVLNHEDLSLERLISICRVLNLELSSLFEEYSNFSIDRLELSESQEKVLSEKPSLLFLWILLATRKNTEEAFKEYGVSQEIFKQDLHQLSNCGLIRIKETGSVMVNQFGPMKIRPSSDLYKKTKLLFIKELKKMDSWTTPGLHKDLDTIFETFEIYLNDDQRAQFCKEMSKLIAKYKNIAHLESSHNNFPNIKPMSGIVRIEQRDLWKQVYQKYLSESKNNAEKDTLDKVRDKILPDSNSSLK